MLLLRRTHRRHDNVISNTAKLTRTVGTVISSEGPDIVLRRGGYVNTGNRSLVVGALPQRHGRKTSAFAHTQCRRNRRRVLLLFAFGAGIMGF